MKAEKSHSVHNATNWAWRKLLVSAFAILICIITQAQDQLPDTAVTRKKPGEGFKFSGTTNIGTNGIAIIPAFALRRPGLGSFLQLQKGRFIYRPQFGFDLAGFPWFMNHGLIYESVKTEKFTMGTGLLWGVGFKHPEVVLNRVLQQAAVGERFFWFELTPEYRLKKNRSISSRVWYGINFEEGSADRVIYISVTPNIDKIKISKKLYFNLRPQFFYLGLDYEQHGFFIFCTAQLGVHNFPVLLTTQFNTPFAHNIEPSPVTLWNYGLTFEF